MKKFLLLSIVAVFLFSCNKLTDKNIVGTWNVTEIKIDGVSQTIMSGTYIDFMEGGTYSFYVASQLSGTGTYSVSSDGETLTISGQAYTVTEKKGKTLKFTWSDGTSSEEWTCEKQ